MMGPGDDLDALSKNGDHLGVLRYIRAHEIRDPEKVIRHGQVLLKNGIKDEAAWSSALEQICLAAIDINNHVLAERCLDELKQKSSVGSEKNKDGSLVKDSDRYRRLLGRCLEAADDYEGAMVLYEKMLKKNPSNLIALQRKYCILRSQQSLKSDAAQVPMNDVVDALNDYLGQQLSDVSGWYEMSRLRLSLADFKGAAYALEQVVLGSPLDAEIHRELGEVYATIGGLNTVYARKHMAQALELDPTNIRAQFGLVCVANQYLDESNAGSKKNIDEHERLVANELVKYGAERVLRSYKGSPMFAIVKRVMDDFTDNL